MPKIRTNAQLIAELQKHSPDLQVVWHGPDGDCVPLGDIGVDGTCGDGSPERPEEVLQIGLTEEWEDEFESAEASRPVEAQTPIKAVRGKCTLSDDLWWCGNCGRGIGAISTYASPDFKAGSWAFCPKCGNPIDWSDAPAVVPDPPADTPATECISCRGYLAEGWHCARCGRDGPLKSPRPPDSPVIPDSSPTLQDLDRKVPFDRLKGYRLSGDIICDALAKLAMLEAENRQLRLAKAFDAPAVADTREREPMTIASLDAETRKIIYLAHIVTKFQATPDRMNKLQDAVAAWDAKHERERNRNLISGIFGVDADTPSDKELK